MTEPTGPGASALNTEFAIDLPDSAAPVLDAAALASLAPFGEERVVDVGDILYRATVELDAKNSVFDTACLVIDRSQGRSRRGGRFAQGAYAIGNGAGSRATRP